MVQRGRDSDEIGAALLGQFELCLEQRRSSWIRATLAGLAVLERD